MTKIAIGDVAHEDLVAAFANAQGDVMTKAFFENGYGVSVIRTAHSYGGQIGLYEVAVLKGTPEQYELCYDSGLTEDVIGWVEPFEVVDFTEAVSSL